VQSRKHLSAKAAGDLDPQIRIIMIELLGLIGCTNRPDMLACSDSLSQSQWGFLSIKRQRATHEAFEKTLPCADLKGKNISETTIEMAASYELERSACGFALHCFEVDRTMRHFCEGQEAWRLVVCKSVDASEPLSSILLTKIRVCLISLNFESLLTPNSRSTN
jgi:hypothetical protein